jgi:hypothetical protein
MSYGFTLDVPIDADVYRQVRELIGAATPAGLISHVVAQRDGGLRYIDVWDSQEAWEAFRVARVEPAVDTVLARIGVPRDASVPEFTEFEVVDTWIADSVSA